jgi:hypothetical protein
MQVWTSCGLVMSPWKKLKFFFSFRARVLFREAQ